MSEMMGDGVAQEGEIAEQEEESTVRKENPPQVPETNPAEAEELLNLKRYYSDACAFTSQLKTALPIIQQLLASKVKSDVVEAIQFLVECQEKSYSEAKVRSNEEISTHWIACCQSDDPSNLVQGHGRL